MELGSPEITPVHKPFPKTAAPHAGRQLVTPACGSVELGFAGGWRVVRLGLVEVQANAKK